MEILLPMCQRNMRSKSILEKSLIEINLFYHSENREQIIANELRKYGLKKILGIEP